MGAGTAKQDNTFGMPSCFVWGRRRAHRITNAEILRCGMVKGGGVLRVEVINQLKKEKGYTNEELAKLSGVPKATLDKITSGKTASPNFDTMEAIARRSGLQPGCFPEKRQRFDNEKSPGRIIRGNGHGKKFRSFGFAWQVYFACVNGRGIVPLGA